MGMNKNTILGWATLIMIVMGLLLIGLGAFKYPIIFEFERSQSIPSITLISNPGPPIFTHVELFVSDLECSTPCSDKPYVCLMSVTRRWSPDNLWPCPKTDLKKRGSPWK